MAALWSSLCIRHQLQNSLSNSLKRKTLQALFSVNLKRNWTKAILVTLYDLAHLKLLGWGPSGFRHTKDGSCNQQRTNTFVNKITYDDAPCSWDVVVPVDPHTAAYLVDKDTCVLQVECVGIKPGLNGKKISIQLDWSMILPAFFIHWRVV